MAEGASHRFEDQLSEVDSDNLNSLDQGGNVYASPVGGLKVDVTPIRGVINGAEVAYGGVSEQALTLSSSNYLYINSSGALVVNTSGFPSYPGTRYFPLAIVVTGVATITSITDRRWKFYA